MKRCFLAKKWSQNRLSFFFVHWNKYVFSIFKEILRSESPQIAEKLTEKKPDDISAEIVQQKDAKNSIEPIVEPSLTDLPVTEALDVIPANLSDLIGAGILPETEKVPKPVETVPELPIVDAPQPANQESMTVEEPEKNTENTEKMDSAPINDDQMDVDESNSVDPMDL